MHSGQTSNIFYDVNALLTDKTYLMEVLKNISFDEHYVGIATGGAIIAGIIHLRHGAKFSMVKDGELKGEFPKGYWTLIDDVVTTGNSLLEAISIVGSKPERIIVVVDRREKNENPKVNSIFEI